MIYPEISSARQLRAEARSVLAGRWGIAIGLVVTVSILSGLVVAALSFIGGNEVLEVVYACLISIFVTTPISIGYYRYFIKFSRGNSDISYRDIFSVFSTNYMTSVYLCGIELLTVAVFYALIFLLSLTSLVSLVLGAIAVFFGLAIFIVFILFESSYFTIAFFVAADEPQSDIKEVLRRAYLLIKPCPLKYITVTLSFFGWFILSLLTLCIGLLWVSPYFTVTTARLYENLRLHLDGIKEYTSDTAEACNLPDEDAAKNDNVNDSDDENRE